MRFFKIAAGLVVGLTLTGCSTTAQAPQTSDLSATDLNALTAADQLIQFDLLECSIIKSNSASGAVLNAAAKICSDANSYKPSLEQLAKAHNVTLPNDLPEDLTARSVMLNYHVGTNEDVQYLRDQITSHEDTLAIFENEAAKGTNPEIIGVAKEVIPVVRNNLTILRHALGSNE